MVLRRGHSDGFAPRRLLAARARRIRCCSSLTTLPAYATLLPEGFFDMAPMPERQRPAAVEADRMSYDGGTGMIAAEGDVVMSYQGYTLRADKIDYDQATGSVRAVGHVVLRDPSGDVYDDGLDRGHRRAEGSVPQLADGDDAATAP